MTAGLILGFILGLVISYLIYYFFGTKTISKESQKVLHEEMLIQDKKIKTIKEHAIKIQSTKDIDSIIDLVAGFKDL